MNMKKYQKNFYQSYLDTWTNMTTLKDLIRDTIDTHVNLKEPDGTPIAFDYQVLLEEIMTTIKNYFEKITN